jgi:hypothetical protein
MNDESEDDYTIDCPNCGEPIYEDAPQCPHCRHYVSSADFGKRFPKWLVVIVVITILSFLLPSLAVIWNSVTGK